MFSLSIASPIPSSMRVKNCWLILSCINVEEIAKWHWPSSSFLLWGQSQASSSSSSSSGSFSASQCIFLGQCIKSVQPSGEMPSKNHQDGNQRSKRNLKLLVKVLFQHHCAPPLYISAHLIPSQLMSFLLHSSNCTNATMITFPLKINLSFQFSASLHLRIITFSTNKKAVVKLGHFRKALEKIDTLETISRVNMQMKSDQPDDLNCVLQ